MKRIVSGIMPTLLIIGMLMMAFNIHTAKAEGTIYIRADGNIDPPTAPIQRNGGVYTLTGNITSDADGIVVEKDNIVVDGADYMVEGTGAYLSNGIFLNERSNVTIKKTNIKNFDYGIKLTWSANNSISGNNIKGSDYSIGIELGSSDHNTIAENNVTACGLYGLSIAYSDFNTVVENNITAGDYIGIGIHTSSNNVLRNNTMVHNEYNFAVEPFDILYALYDVVNDVDTSNTVDGKPIYYWVNQRDMIVPPDAGYVALIECRNITVQDLDLRNNQDGVILVKTVNSTVINNNITNNFHGIFLAKSSSNSISLNDIEAVTGISFVGSSNNVVCRNNITKRWSGSIAGIHLITSSNNNLFENNVTKNNYGVYINHASGNSLNHNNFIDNSHQAYSEVLGYSNSWDNGYPFGGNYWSDHNGTDSNNDGMGDTSYVIDANNQDNCPLMHPYGSVRDLNTSLVYLTIQSAINAPETLSGHTIFVEAGTYYENVIVNKTILLLGEDKSATTIDGSGLGSVIYIEGINDACISNFTIQNSLAFGLDEGSGIYLRHSSNNIISGNVIVSNGIGIYIRYDSDNNTITENEIRYNGAGISLYYSSNNNLTYNRMIDNFYNLAIGGIHLSHFCHSIDTSNTVDDKPVHYLANQKDLVIDNSTFPNIGYLGLVNSTNITVRNLNIANSNGEEVLFAFTTNSGIECMNVSTNGIGISMVGSNNNNLIHNTLSRCGLGIFLDQSGDNFISNNTVACIEIGISIVHNTGNIIKNNMVEGNLIGIQLASTSENRIIDNVIASNAQDGMYIASCENNTIYHNNFINNTRQVFSDESQNVWDDGFPSGGNYWSDYSGADSNHNGIGDSNYTINTGNVDRYPSMGMFCDFNATSECRVQTICNSSISSFQNNATSISFNVTGNDGTVGFCRICIPTALMNATYRVFVNGTEVSYSVLSCSNTTHSYLYFNYTHSTKEIVIIPELTSLIILPLFMMATLLAVTVYRRKTKISDLMQDE